MLKDFLLVGLGGGIGSMLRYATSMLFTSRLFPYSTIVVNVCGSFIIGLVLVVSLLSVFTEKQRIHWKTLFEKALNLFHT